MKPPVLLLLICLGTLALRLALLPFVQHPGIADPNHYYNLGLRLVEGHGFTIDYVWHFYNPPAALVHPDDFWMPLAGALAAAGMALFGTSVQAALLPFVALSALLPVVSYLAARQFGCGNGASLFAAAAAGFLPELALYSLRTDTVVPNSLLLTGAILLLVYGLKRDRWWAFAGSGLMAGLAYLTRSENLLLLPMLVVTLLVYARRGRREGDARRWGYALLLPLVALIVVSPWLARNLQTGGSLTTPNLSRMFFMTDFRDHFAYGRDLTLQTLLASQTPGQLIGKRLFEMAASVKIMYTTLDLFLPVAVVGGFILLAAARDRERWLTFAPTLILLGGMFVFWTLVAPFGSQGGSFKKAYVSLIPLLLPLAGYALERAAADARIRHGAMALVVGFLAANAVEAARADIRFTNGYLERARRMAEVARTLPDANGDGALVLMAQDPYMVRFVGYSSVMFPQEDRDSTLEVARRYGVDYLLMPPDRPALDALYTQTETDPRIQFAAAVPGTEYAFYTVAGSSAMQGNDNAP